MQAQGQKGFTLIELMVTLVVLVVSLSIGVPSFTTWIKNNRVDEKTRVMASLLQLARSEAVTRQSIVSVRAGTSSNPGSWANGAHIYTASSGNTNYQTATDILIKDITLVSNAVEIKSNDTNDIVSFADTGLLDEPDQRVFAVCDDRGTAKGFSITLNTVGRTTIDTVDNCAP